MTSQALKAYPPTQKALNLNLLHAILHEPIEEISNWIDSGAEIDYKYTEDDCKGACDHEYIGCTPLMIAIAHGEEEKAEELINLGADIHATDDIGFNALFHAAWCGDNDTMRILIDRGADINHKSNDNENLLVILARTNRFDLVDKYIHGIREPYARDLRGQSFFTIQLKKR